MHRWNKNKKHIQPNFSGRMCFFACYLGKESVPLLLQRFLNSNSHGNGSTDHRIVAHAQEAHHFHAAMLSGCRVRPVPPPEATEKYFLPCSMHSFL